MIQCYDSMANPIEIRIVDSNEAGAFSFSCPAGTKFFDGEAMLRHPGSLDVRGTGSSFVGSYIDFQWYEGQQLDLRAASDYAAHFYMMLRPNVHLVYSKFGYFRPAAMAEVAQDNNAPVNYVPWLDLIQSRPDHIFTWDQWGYFVTVHEYGHAYQYVAIEPWESYYCSPSGVHFIDGEYTLSCGYVEGFADFFAVWVAGHVLISGYGSDYQFEQNPFRSNGDGARIEGAVAGFFYDLVDGPYDPNGVNNQSTGSDDDPDQYPGYWIAQLMRNCSVDGLQRLDGIDQSGYPLSSRDGMMSGWISRDPQWLGLITRETS
jgi:hypothetical protein